MVASPKPFVTIQEYLDLERKHDTKYEYIDGTLVAMVGASPNHNRIQTNLIGNLFPIVDRRGCEIFGSDMRVRIERLNVYTYPDFTITCGEPQFADGPPDALLNPQVIVEILSPSTESYDRVRKFARYRRLASLREYVLIAQDMPLVEHYVRQADGTWLLSVAENLDGEITFLAIDCTLALSKIYARVTFEPEDAVDSGED